MKYEGIEKLTKLSGADWCMIRWVTEENLQMEKVSTDNWIFSAGSLVLRVAWVQGGFTAQDPPMYSWKSISPKVVFALKLGTTSVRRTMFPAQVMELC